MRAPIHKQSIRAANGFTLLEVLAVMLASSILALTAGIMLYSASKSTQTLRSAISAQRDEQIAMDTLMRLARAGTNLSFTVSPPRFTVQRAGYPISAVYASSNSLYFSPNTNVAAGLVQLINGTLWGPQFSITFSNNVTRNINMVTILLVQQANSNILSNLVTITRRN